MTELQMNTLLFLIWNSVADIRRKVISVAAVLVFMILRVFWFFLYVLTASADMVAAIIGILTGMIPGLLLCVIGKVSRGAVGLGDGLVVIVTGAYIGIMQTIEVITWAFFLAFIFSMVMLLLKKYKSKSTFPFVPFLLIGLIISVWN